MPVTDLELKTPAELQKFLGQRIKAMRISSAFSQGELAAKAGVSLKTLRNLELGHGSSTETMLRTLKALKAVSALDLLFAAPTVSPMALLQNAKAPQRVRRALKHQ